MRPMFWYKAEFKNQRGTFYAVRFDPTEGVCILQPFDGGDFLRYNKQHVENNMQFLGPISNKAAEYRGITSLLKGGYCSCGVGAI